MSSDRTHGQCPSSSPSSAEAAKAASANASAGESLQSPLLAKTWKQSPIKLTVIIALTVVAAEIIIDMAGPAVFNRVVGPLAGAVAGAGLCILRSLREAGVREEASIVGAAAVAGGVAGTVAAEILQLLLAAQSQRGSAIIGTMAGAAIIAVSGLHMQLVIDTVKRVIALVEREISAIQWGTKVTKLASLTATVIGVSKSAIAAVLKMSQSAALAIAAGAAAASHVVAGAEASGVAAEGSTASGVAATIIRVSKSAIAAAFKMLQSAALGVAAAAGAAAASHVVAGAEASGVAAEGSTASGVAATIIRVSKSAIAAAFKMLQSAALGVAAAAGAAAASHVVAGAEASGVAAEGSTASGVAATIIRVSESAIAAAFKMSQTAASGIAEAAGTVEGHVAGSGINGSQQEGHSDTQAPVMVKALEEQIHSSELKKPLTALQRRTEFLEEENKEWQHKHTKAETEAKGLRFTVEELKKKLQQISNPPTAAPAPPPPPAPSSNPLSSLQSILCKKKNMSSEIALVEKDSSEKTPEKKTRQQAMDEMMQQIKNGVQLRHVSQTTCTERTLSNYAIEELQGILTSSSPGTTPPSLKTVLEKALHKRREAFHPN